MSKQDYKRLTIEEFGRHLITSGDLDPVYISLGEAMDDTDQLYRWLIAYWCFYHCGVASYMSEYKGQEFWKKMLVAAHNELPAPDGGRWPRAKERRHARGLQGIAMVARLRSKYGAKPEQMVDNLVVACGGGVNFSEISRRVRVHILFGPWIAFKVGDMLERVLECPINFDNSDVFFFKDPHKAALMVWRTKMGLPEGAKPRNEGVVIREIVDYLKGEFSDLQAPPGQDRPIDLQECETILCKFKSHLSGHYPLYNDIDEICEGLEVWGDTAKSFLRHMPKRPDHG